jgi:hypothetical protein
MEETEIRASRGDFKAKNGKSKSEVDESLEITVPFLSVI